MSNESEDKVEVRKVNTSRFGEIEVEEKRIVHFANGIPAFEDETEFVILPYDEESPYYFMQSIKTPDLAFLVTIPFMFFGDYTVELDDDTVSELGIEDRNHVLLYSIITIPNGNYPFMTANLLAPVVVNRENMKAKQVVLEKTEYTTKHRLFPDKAKGDRK